MSLLAGTAIADISPGAGLELGGYPHFPRNNTGVHDPLHASCIFLDDGKSKIAIIALDILFYSKKHVASIRERIERETGIPHLNIMVSCSHTHSGPWASGRLDIDSLMSGVKQDEEYVNSLNGKIVSIVKEAVANAFVAKIGYSKGHCGREQGIGGNRREIGGPCDPLVSVLSVADRYGSVKAALVNYTLHPTVIHEDSAVVTADYPGYIRKYLKSALPGMNLLFTQGASGNQSSRYFRQGQSYDEAERIGYAIGREAASVLGGIEYKENAALFAVSEEVAIELRSLPTKDEMLQKVSEAKEEYERLRRVNAQYLEVQNANLKLLGAEDLLGYIQMFEQGQKIELYEDEKEAEVQVLGIGDARIVGLPGEVFVEFGLEIKKQSPYPFTVISEIANGCLPGYVCTREAYAAGGYETDTSLLSADFGYKLAQTAIRLLKQEK